MNRLLSHRSKTIRSLIDQNRQLFMFLIIGVINTIFGYSVFAIFLFLHVPDYMAVILSTALGLLFNFKTTGIFVFKNKNNKLLLKFVMNAGVICIMTIVLIKMLNLFIFNSYISGAIATSIMPFFSYYLSKRIFTTKSSKYAYEEI